MVLGQIFPREAINVHLESTEKDELFEEMTEVLHSVYPEVNREEALKALRERESKMSTGIVHSVAVPHGHCASLKTNIGAIGVSKAGVDYDALDGEPVHVIFMMLIAPTESERHVQTLRQLSLVLQTPDFVQKILQCSSAADVYNVLSVAEDSLNI